MSTATQTIRDIVTTQPTAAAILQRFEIDLCSQAETPLEDACAQLQLSVDQVLEKLADAEAKAHGASSVDPAVLSAGRLIQHIVRVHHQYVRQQMPVLAEMARKLADMRADRAPELKNVTSLLDELHADIFAHLQKEEQILFPFIAQMGEASIIAPSPVHACFGSVERPIFMMMNEHESAGRIVEDLRRITHGFEPPPWACTTHIALYGGIRAFEIDLKQHVHLENDILFPRALEMEAALNLLR